MSQLPEPAAARRKLALRASVAFVAACLVYGGAKGFLEGYYDGKDPVKARAAAKVQGIQGCIAKANETAAQKGMTSAQVTQYCDCAVTKSVDSFTDDELKAAGHHTKGTLTPAEQAHFTAAMRTCNDELREGLTTAPPAGAPAAPVVNP